MEAIRIVEAGELKKDRGGFEPGDTVKVMVKVVEGEKERLQAFEGVVIRRRGGGTGASFTVRRISYGVGRGAHVPGALAADRQDPGDEAGDGAAVEALLPPRAGGQGGAPQGEARRAVPASRRARQLRPRDVARGRARTASRAPPGDEGVTRLAGVDEAGRGPLAGPVVAAAVMLAPGHADPRAWTTRSGCTPEQRAELFDDHSREGAGSGRGGRRSPHDRSDQHPAGDPSGDGPGPGRARPRAGAGADRLRGGAGPVLPAAQPGRRRPALGLGGRGLDRGQGHARPDHGGRRPGVPASTDSSATRATRPRSTGTRSSATVPARCTAAPSPDCGTSSRCSREASCSGSAPIRDGRSRDGRSRHGQGVGHVPTDTRKVTGDKGKRRPRGS